MKIIKNSLAKNILQKNKSDKLFNSLNRLLNESAICSVKLNYNAKNDFEAAINIIDGNVHVASTQFSDNPLVAIDLAINSCVSQLSKLKGKHSTIENKSIRYFDGTTFKRNIDKNIQLQSSTLDILETLSYEKELENIRQTDKYQRVADRYTNYLTLDYDIERAENQLGVLYSILEAIDYETISYAEMLRLIESIDLLNKEINFMLHKKKMFETNKKHQNETNEIIAKEVKLLNLKRKCNL